MPEEILLPEKTPDIIESILKKNNLLSNEDDLNFDKFLEEPEKYQDLIEKSPSYKLSTLIGSYMENQITMEMLSVTIEKELGVTKEKADKITEELKEKILDFIKPAAEGPVEKPIEKSTESPKPSRKSDTYREQVE